MLFSCLKCVSLLIKETNLILNLQNYRKKGKKYKKVKGVMIIEKKDLGELRIKFKGIIVVLLIHVRDHMDLKDH